MVDGQDSHSGERTVIEDMRTFANDLLRLCDKVDTRMVAAWST